MENNYTTWNSKQGSQQAAFAALSTALEKVEPIFYGSAATASRTSFTNIDTNISARPGFTRQDYDWFRCEEEVPKKQKDIIAACMNAYRRVGLIRNVIDLMADFAVKGIRPEHPSPRIQAVYRDWWANIDVPERSERIANALLRCGVAYIQRDIANTRMRPIRNKLKDTELVTSEKEIAQIPWRYSLLNPLFMDPIAPELSAFSGQRYWGIEIPYNVRKQINNPQNKIEQQIVNSLPANIRAAAKIGNRIVPLDPARLKVLHYKKDDWKVFADPLIYAVLDDIILFEKMKLADSAALDSVITNVRLWTLGDLEHKIVPNRGAIERLSAVLRSNVGGGGVDLVWGPELKLQQVDTNVHQFLGEAKYKPVLDAIYAGLGIPPSLTGSSSAPGFTNNFVSLKVLIERLNYVRSILTEFWEAEMRDFQQAMGFRQPAKVQFDYLMLDDDSSLRALLIQLFDRNIVSEETIQERFHFTPEIERSRTVEEEKLRESGEMVEKAGPFVQEEEIGISGQGRPMNSKDSDKRKRENIKPRTKVNASAEFFKYMRWANHAQKFVSETLSAQILKTYGKENFRQLTNDQVNEVEKVKFAVLMQLTPEVELTEEIVAEKIGQNLSLDDKTMALYNEVYNAYSSMGKVSLDDVRDIKSTVFAIIKGENNGEN